MGDRACLFDYKGSSQAKKRKCCTCSPVWITGFKSFHMAENSNFDRLLKRYMHDRVTPQERNRLEAWLDADKTGADNGFVWKEEDARKLLGAITANMDRVDLKPAADGRGTKRAGICQWLRLAASVLLLVSGC